MIKVNCIKLIRKSLELLIVFIPLVSKNNFFEIKTFTSFFYTVIT